MAKKLTFNYIPGTSINRKEVETFMARIAPDHMECGAVMCTELAEEAAAHFGSQIGLYPGETGAMFDLLCEIAYHVAVQYEAQQNALLVGKERGWENENQVNGWGDHANVQSPIAGRPLNCLIVSWMQSSTLI